MQERIQAWEEDSEDLADMMKRLYEYVSLPRSETSKAQLMIEYVDRILREPTGSDKDKRAQLTSFLPSSPEDIAAFPARRLLPGEQKPWHSQTGRQTPQPPRPNHKSKPKPHKKAREPNTFTEQLHPPNPELNGRVMSFQEQQQDSGCPAPSTDVQFNQTLSHGIVSSMVPTITHTQPQPSPQAALSSFQFPDNPHLSLPYNSQSSPEESNKQSYEFATGCSVNYTPNTPRGMSLPTQSRASYPRRSSARPTQETPFTRPNDGGMTNLGHIEEHPPRSTGGDDYMASLPSLNFESSSTESGASPYESPPPQTPTPSSAPEWPVGWSPTPLVPEAEVEAQKDIFNFSDYLYFDGVMEEPPR
jgi:hypothetical protein